MKHKKISYFVIIIAFLSISSVLAITFISDNEIETPLVIAPNIEMGNSTLNFLSLNRTIAIFNGDATFITPLGSPLNATSIFGNGQNIFLGDVVNIDDVNSSSRFREVNINNGTSASAAFTATNDLGHATSFGIGSSQFKLAGVDFNNEAAIFHNSPGKFNMFNVKKVSWNWIVNELNSSTNLSFVNRMELSPEGDLDVVGKYTGDLIQLRTFDPKPTCNVTTEGSIVYEANGTKGDFFGCKLQNMNTFVWAKFS